MTTNGAKLGFSLTDEKQMGSVKMQAAAKSNLVLTDFSSLRWLSGIQEPVQHTESYQQIGSRLVRGKCIKQVLADLGKRLVVLAQNAYTLRQIESLEEISQVLMNLPMPEYRSIGLYYHALVLKRKGNTTLAKGLLEHVADFGLIQYRTQALLSLGTLTLERGEIPSALSFYLDSIKLSSRADFATSVRTFKMIAVLKAIDGNHPGAIADLEKLFPAARMVSAYNPQFFYDYLNSLVLELGEVGRIKEATNISRIVLASPFTFAYPEWRETWQDLALRGYKSRSVVSVLKPALDKDNVVPLPVVERSSDPPQQGRAKLFDLQKWAKKMGKKPNGNGKKLPENMTSRDMVIKLMNLTTQEGISDEKLQKIIDYVEKLLSEPD